MYFIYNHVKKNLIFDEMRKNNNATTLHCGAEKQSNLKQTRNEIIGQIITIHGLAFPYWALIRRGLLLILLLIL